MGNDGPDALFDGPAMWLRFTTDGSVTYSGFSLWAISMPPNASADFNCTFERGFCGWRQSNEDSSNWILQNGQTPSFNPGPLFDTTLGRTLNVYHVPVNQTISEGEIIFTSGHYVRDWIKARSCVRNATSEFQIALEALHGNSFRSYTAIDDINTVIPRMFLFDSTEDFPANDGEAVLIEGEDHAFTCMVPHVNRDVEFVWTLAGQRVKQVSSRSVDTIDGLSASSNIIVSPNGEIPVHGKTLQCEAFDADGELIDNMTVSIAVKGFNCTFEEGLCDWRQSDEDGSNWLLQQGRTPSSNTGPDFDRTLDASGQYVYYEASSGYGDTNAILISPVISPSGEQPYNKWCFSFWYNMYGRDMGKHFNPF
ncbi:MAM and LDL-receptor class A domain-containing protein 1-like [Patiria miniata]|uniref:Ig-like domain-containing protein n=1 Tax=Patiria miniata TaxID=46514 RepID=A0A914AFN0_PATMI|nr:MAM and LDL-receptor class A domain-containing protein 1-like [Patiria miniata]